MNRVVKNKEKRRGPRIVRTTRTAKQREASRAYNRRGAGIVAITAVTSGLPQGSWWTQPRTREAFDQVAQREAKRMKESRFGQAFSPVLEG
jgi:hypothetical protein